MMCQTPMPDENVPINCITHRVPAHALFLYEQYPYKWRFHLPSSRQNISMLKMKLQWMRKALKSDKKKGFEKYCRFLTWLLEDTSNWLPLV